MSEFITPVQVAEATAVVRSLTDKTPTIALVLGSGLSSLADGLTHADIISSANIPHWPASTVSGHKGRLIIGELEDKVVLVLQGRSHYYEGLSMNQITLPVRVMAGLGIRTLIVTNAAGGINADFTPGDLMLIKDHLNMLGMAGHNPLRGPNDDHLGPRFPDMTEPYNAHLRQMAHATANKLGFQMQEGVYAYVAGPSYETPAELRFLRMAGADAVGMSTVPSVVVARHAGMQVLGISTITNMAVPDPAPGTTLTHDEVLETGKRVIPRLTNLIHSVVRQIK
ncbi:MAG: purine-nucleoside phosphorylase [Ardenticatenaceae bacterium]|nr:purine-nucleoside phosphorylase [Ardenticatenaceae bacterium]MCB9003305.1 purine-nucleoside phosphorylase [Ardenticatenaceae bacterium]